MKRKALYRMMISFILLSSIPILVFVFKFGGPLSDDLQDWAHFGNYIAGTVGVVALIATLDALLFTIKQQDSMLEHQEIQLNNYDAHQRKVEAYSRADKIFPALLEERKRALEENAYEYLKKTGLVGEFFTDLPMKASLKDILEKKEVAEILLSVDPNDRLSMLALHAHSGSYMIICFMRDCILDAKELRDYFFSIMGDYSFIITVTLSFSRAELGEDEFYRLCNIFNVSELPTLDGSVEKIWEEIGKKLHASQYPVRLTT